MEDLEKFKNYLEKNTKLSESTIILYVRTIKRFFSRYPGEITIENINEFVSEGYRENHNYYNKYVFKFYLKSIDQKKLYEDIVQVKKKPRIRHGNYIPDHLIQSMIKNIERELYRDIAMVQYATAARAHEIIKLLEENIEIEEDAIKLYLHGKRDKERVSFLKPDFIPILKKYMRGKAGYIFLPERCNNMDEFELQKEITNMRTYYYEQIQNSIKHLGLKSFGTHDFRRNAAQSLREKGIDLITVKDILGHSSINQTAEYFDHKKEDIKNGIMKHQGDSNV